MRLLETRCRAFHTTGHSNSHSDWFHLRCLLRPIRFYTSTLSIVSFIHSFICNLIFHNSTNIFHNIFNAHENEIIHTCTIYSHLFTETNYKHTGVNGNPRNGCSPFNRFLDARFKGTIKNEKLHAYRSVRIGTSFHFSEKFVLQNSMAIFWVFFSFFSLPSSAIGSNNKLPLNESVQSNIGNFTQMSILKL